MISITDTSRSVTYLAANAISQVTEAGPSSQWHGINAYVRTFDGKVLEATETAHEIAEAIAKEVQGLAPVLLEATQALLNALPSATTHPAIKQARAAIAKATGEPHVP